MNLIRNSAWNIAGFAIPILIAIPAMGYLARVLGVEKFGLFTLANALVGYASVFDVGLSRAVIRFVAINVNDDEKLGKIVGTATCFIFILSIFASLILFLSASKIIEILSVSNLAKYDAVMAFQWLSLAVIPLLLSTIWFSYLEGNGNFSKLNLLKSSTGITVFLFPVVFVFYEVSLTSAIIGLIVGRFVTMIVAYIYGLSNLKKSTFVNERNTLKELFSFGGWITISNILSPMMVYFDRFLISNIVGAQSVAFYTAPGEVVTRLLLIPIAVAKVIFPKLCAKHDDAESQTRLAYKILVLFSMLIALLIFIFADTILLLWLGPKYLGEAVVVFRVLIIGFVFNSIAQIPFARIQAAGYSKITSLIHAFEVVPYFLLLYFLLLKFSLIGAAIAWTFRVLGDYLLLEFYSRKLVGKP
jgi:O-antigen/teichoic acid export membrane protein